MQGKTGAAHNRSRGDTGMGVREQKPDGINILQHRHTPPQSIRYSNRNMQSEGTGQAPDARKLRLATD